MNRNTLKSTGVRLRGVICGLLTCAAFAPAAHAATTTSWPFSGGDLLNSRSNPAETLLSPKTVSGLSMLWSYSTGGNVSATPTIDGDDLYFTDTGGNFTKLDRLTGAVIWNHQVGEYTGITGSASRNSPAIGDTVVIIGDQASATIMAIDKTSGTLVWKTTVDTQPLAKITSSPVISNGFVYTGVSSTQEGSTGPYTFRGSVVALNLATGALVWQFYTVPEGYTGGAVWGSTVVPDPKRGLIYATTGDNYTVPDAVTSCDLAAISTAQQFACMAPDNYVDSVIALNMTTGALVWGDRMESADTYTILCTLGIQADCPDAGPDYDFGSGVNFINATIGGKATQLLGAGQKSGKYWLLNPDDGSTVWVTQVGPGGLEGGIEWGSATDNTRIYAAIANSAHRASTVVRGNQRVQHYGGSWGAVDVATGKILWQIPQTGRSLLLPFVPASTSAALTVANGVLYAGAQSGDMDAIDAANGTLLWSFPTAGSIIDGPSIVGGIVYWASGYGLPFGKANNVLYAFSVPTASSAKR